jgi:DNA-binding beta-propeller fold protein YncE
MRRRVALVVLMLATASGVALICSVMRGTSSPVLRTIAVAYPGAVAVDERAGRALVTNNDNVSLLDTRALR